MLETFLEIFSWATVVITISLSIPQLYKLLREKETKKVNFYSFWIFHLGILLWCLFGVLTEQSNPWKLQNIVIADGISLLLNGVMTYLLYHYKFKPNNDPKFLVKRLGAAAGVIVTWIVGIIFTILYYKIPTMRISAQANVVFSLVAPGFTTFSFAPQLYTSIKTKNWKGVSPMMFALFEVNNLAWITFWILSMVKYGSTPELIGGLIWQCISLALYGFQLYKTFEDVYKNKEAMRNFQA